MTKHLKNKSKRVVSCIISNKGKHKVAHVTYLDGKKQTLSLDSGGPKYMANHSKDNWENVSAFPHVREKVSDESCGPLSFSSAIRNCLQPYKNKFSGKKWNDFISFLAPENLFDKLEQENERR